jgi:cobalt/nickel transport system permease protein
MHVPDGFIAPQMYLPAYGLAAGLWAYAARRLRAALREETIPRLAVLTAFCFVVMMVMVPLPGGTSVHATGVALLALLFGVWTAFISVSLVLLLQALLFGAGGVTSLALNALAVGLVGSAAARCTYGLLRRIHEGFALVAAGWLSVNVSALLMALVLGVQPLIAHANDGHPLFFPFGLSVTLPAVMIPHVLIGIGDGALTLFMWRLLDRRGWVSQS